MDQVHSGLMGPAARLWRVSDELVGLPTAG
jgi:hypothetical protein